MKVIVDLCVVPIGVGVNLAPYIAACERVLLDTGLKIQLHLNGTAIEGEWGPVFAAIEACHTSVHAMGALPGLIQSVSQAPWPGLSASGEVGEIASSLCPKPFLPQPIST